MLNGGLCGHAFTGCITTAMAQVMKYHNYPPNYSWSAMNDIYATNETAVLMGDIFPHVITTYDVNGSGGPFGGSGTHDVDDAFTSHFGYSSAEYHDNVNASYGDLIRNNIRNNLPVIFGGVDSNADAGHAWVCDGFDVHEYDTYTTSTFHMNWGWYMGYCNGYFSWNLFNSSVGNFNDNLQLVTNIHP